MSLSYPDTEAAPSLLQDQAPQEPKRPQDDERQALRRMATAAPADADRPAVQAGCTF